MEKEVYIESLRYPTPRDILQISFVVGAEMDRTRFWEGLGSSIKIESRVIYIYPKRHCRI